MSIWKKLKQDLKERLLKFETIRGLYLVPAGILGIWVIIYHFQFILHAIGAACFGYMIVDGVRKIGVNRVKQAIKDEENVIKRKLFNDSIPK